MATCGDLHQIGNVVYVCLEDKFHFDVYGTMHESPDAVTGKPVNW